MAVTALATVQDYVTDARILVQDTVSPYRYEDASLLTGLNLALLEARRLRPDLFLGVDANHQPLLDNVPQYSTVDTTEVPMEAQFRMAILSGMCAHVLLRDQEDIQDERTAQMMLIFNSVLVGQRVVLPLGNK